MTEQDYLDLMIEAAQKAMSEPDDIPEYILKFNNDAFEFMVRYLSLHESKIKDLRGIWLTGFYIGQLLERKRKESLNLEEWIEE